MFPRSSIDHDYIAGSTADEAWIIMAGWLEGFAIYRLEHELDRLLHAHRENAPLRVSPLFVTSLEIRAWRHVGSQQLTY